VSELKERVLASRQRKAEIEQRFGFIPHSVIRGIGRGKLSNSMFVYQRERPQRGPIAKDLTAERRALGVKGGTLSKETSAGRENASTMPAELVEFFVRYYAKAGDVYLDPFMGQGIQLQVAKAYGLHYYGYDLCREFFDYTDAVRNKIDDGETEIKIFCADSADPDEIPDGVGDFSFHSPPYWNIEYYGDDPAQLGNNDYDGFLEAMVAVYQAWLQKFKPGAWHVVNVNDFRRKGIFYPYHADTIAALRAAGWSIHDVWIIEGLVGGISRIFAVNKNASKIAPKIHEYAIVAKAPE
jgi:DNA modification methylase